MSKQNNKSPIRLQALAEQIGAALEGNGDIDIHGAAPIHSAQAGEITFVANKKYARFLTSTKASAVVIDKETEVSGLTVLRHDNPYLAFAIALDLLYPDPVEKDAGVDTSAVISKTASIAQSACIGPLCHINASSVIGERTRLISSVFVGENVTIGSDCVIYPGVRILDDTRIGNNVFLHPGAVIGSDGFGFAPTGTGLKKIKQVGWVVIEDDVEIGANSTIDRGALGPTRIGKGTKIDNLVQIAHNVETGQYCILVAQVGVSGSTKLGNGVMAGGQAGFVGHLEIGDGVSVGAQSGVAKSVERGKTVFGSPARDIMFTKRIEAALPRLPELLKRVKALEEKSGRKS